MRSGNAIASSTEDRLGRARFADQLAAALRGAPAEQGLVVALVGEWGSGKTSVLNMVAERLAEAPSRIVLTFNPWMFSGTEQLVGTFFEQVGGQLRLKGGFAEALAGKLINYGEALSPLVFVPVAGVWLGRISAVANAAAAVRGSRKAPDPVEAQRQGIEEALGKLTEPIVVVIDDIDRLTPDEARSMLGLVRLTAHFPKVIYLLAFDRAKVERALSAGGLDDGRSYLDKIIEVVYDMPAVSQPRIERLLLDGLETAISGITAGPFDEERWPDVFSRVLRPLLNTPREVGRYLAPLPAMLNLIGPEVGMVDVLALEALRVRLPDVFAQLGPMTSALTAAGMRTSQTPDWESAVRDFTALAESYEPAVQDLCRLLFPATGRYLGSTTTYSSEWLPRWRRDRRVANPEVLSIYLGKQVPPGAVAAATVDQAVAALNDREALQAIVDGVDTDGLDDLLARLEAYEEDFQPEAALPACTVLLRLYPRLRTRSLGFLDPGPEFAVERVVLRLLRRVSAAERTEVVESLCADVAGLTGRIRLLYLAGRLPNPEYERLIPAGDSDRLYRQVCSDIRHASPAQLSTERKPLDLVAAALAEDPSDRGDVDRALSDDEFAAALLISASSDVRSQTLGSIATRTEQILRWDELRTVAGNDRAFSALLERAATMAVGNQELGRVVGLARKYQSGWRPQLGPLASRPLVIRQPLTVPNMYFPPSSMNGDWPALHLRAATVYEVDPVFARQADVSGREFHWQTSSQPSPRPGGWAHRLPAGTPIPRRHRAPKPPCSGWFSGP